MTARACAKIRCDSCAATSEISVTVEDSKDQREVEINLPGGWGTLEVPGVDEDGHERPGWMLLCEECVVDVLQPAYGVT